MTINEDTSAARVVAVLEALALPHPGQGDGLTVSELARELGRDKSSVSRNLKSLIDLGLVEKNANGKHVLGWRVFTIAARAGDQRLLLAAPAVMRQIGRQTGERVHLSIRRQDEVLTILTEGPMRAIGAVGWVGRTVPILGTSSGRALMLDDSEEEVRAIFEQSRHAPGGRNFPATADEAVSRLRKAKAKGYAANIDEFEDGLSAVAAPIRDAHGRIIAAINVSAPSYRFADKIDEFSKIIHRAAIYLSRTMSTPTTMSSAAHDLTGAEDADAARTGERQAS